MGVGVEPIDTTRILASLEERRRWEQRRTKLLEEMKRIPAREKAILKAQLVNIDTQISYYTSLLRDMKKEFRPNNRSAILNKG